MEKFYIRRYFGIVPAYYVALAAVLATRQYYHAADAGRLPSYAEPSLLVFHFAKFAVGMLIYEAGRAQAPFALGRRRGTAARCGQGYGTSAVLLLAAVPALAACSYCGMPRWMTRGFKSRPVTFFSDASYSVYLIHNMTVTSIGWPVLAWIIGMGAPLWASETALTVSVVATAYPLAYIMFRVVERAGVEWASEWHTRVPPVAAPMT